VKQRDLVKTLEANGCYLVRHGANHDWYAQPKTGVLQAVPRHREIDEHLAKRIIKDLT
jgi:mRNA interferase HicA